MDAIITLTGNLGADPRIRTVGTEQTPVTEFNIAHTPRLRQGEEWKDGATTWYRITCWRKLAENVVGSLRRGDAIIVTGRLLPTEWVDKNGVVQRSDEVHAITVGPDLSRGRAYVIRNPRGRAQEVAEESGELVTAGTEPDETDIEDLEYLAQDEHAPQDEQAPQDVGALEAVA